ncbi:MAG: glycosyltransferase [SAR324 cluster bacterium]|nr:glycosyltransferase [SAR324 cluster bacterium]
MKSSLPGVVISVYNDAEALRQTLPTLVNLFEEIIIVDNQSQDDCETICQQHSLKHIRPPADTHWSRGQCWNHGAAHVQSDSILFLHADTVISREAVDHLRTAWTNGEIDYSCFRICFQEDSLKFRIIEQISNSRSRFLKVVYGDQGLCVRKKVFKAIGGFPEEYLLEDLKINRYLRKYPFCFINSPIFPSSRKFHQTGFYRYLLLMNVVLLLNLLGMSTKRIYQLYYFRKS